MSSSTSSSRASRFIAFIAESALAGNSSTLKEYVLGVDHLRRFYYDTAASYNVSARQIVSGSDFPMAPIPVVVSGLDQCGLTGQELSQVYRDNARCLFSLRD